MEGAYVSQRFGHFDKAINLSDPMCTRILCVSLAVAAKINWSFTQRSIPCHVEQLTP